MLAAGARRTLGRSGAAELGDWVLQRVEDELTENVDANSV
jgi:hypothetical protein